MSGMPDRLKFMHKRRTQMSPRQTEVLAFCVTYHRQHGRTPEAREIAEHFRWERKNARQADTHLFNLENYGVVKCAISRSGRLIAAELTPKAFELAKAAG